MYEYFDKCVLVIVLYVIISYRACSPLGALYLQINAVVRKEPSFDFTYTYKSDMIRIIMEFCFMNINRLHIDYV